VTITVRTYRRPEAALLAAFEPDVTRLNALLTTPARPQWSMLTADALLCGYLGDARTVSFYESELPRHRPVRVERRSVEDDVRHRQSVWRPSGFRASVPPASIRRFVDQLQPASWSADAAFGVVVGSRDASNEPTLERAARDVGGSILFFDSSGRPSRLSSDPNVGQLLDRLKAGFDPRGALEPIPVPTS
jgi:hypothetical protein